MACHQRSVSLPYSSESNVELELHGLKSCIFSLSATIDTMCGGYARLGDIYKCIEEIMGLPSNQVGLSFPQNKKMVEEELERSLVLIDLCNSMQENLAELQMSAQELQLVLKRGDDASVQLKVESFIRLAKQAQKPFKKIASSKASGEDCRLVRLLAEEKGRLSLYSSPRCSCCRSSSPPPKEANGLLSRRERPFARRNSCKR
uniref:Uncharacterized protein n=1 Tax=Hordeum vulgare subsp. vulgare TaxID=112509 RepID=A0A8I6XY35_HORVV